MAHDRTFRFGVQLHNAIDGPGWRALARKAEELGYSTLFLPDHFGDQLAPVPALQAAADCTTTLRVGALVFDNDYKHPLVLAKEMATLDVLSGGRVEFGLGAGWMRTDYEQSGIPYDAAGVRIDRFLEGLAVVKGCLGPAPFDFTGKHYQITQHNGLPKPIQAKMPVLIGGGGKRVLTIAGQEADIVGINANMEAGAITPEVGANVVAEATAEKVGWVKAAAGDRYADIELNVLVFAVVVTDDRKAMLDMLSPAFNITPEQAAGTPHALVGTVDEIVETLEQRRADYDISYVVVQGDAMDAFAPVVARLAGT